MLFSEPEVLVSLEDTFIEEREVFYRELDAGKVSLLSVEIIPEYPIQSGFSIQDFFEWCYLLDGPSDSIEETHYSLIFQHDDPIQLTNKRMLDSIHVAYELSLAELSQKVQFQYRYRFRSGQYDKRFVIELSN